MATRLFYRSIIPSKLAISSLFSRSFASISIKSAPSHFRFRPLIAAATNFRVVSPSFSAIRGLATRETTSSLNDSSPNWSNRPPKETILLDGCDFEHWLVVVDKPADDLTRDDIIDGYIKTLSTVVGSEEEARMKIYSVSTRHYFAFGALVSEELSYKLKELPHVRWVLPDSYLDVKNKDYGGEPFINGQAVPYDPKYHEEWVKNNARANERNRRNDRPKNFDRSRNFERRRENVQQQMGHGGPPRNMGPPQNMGGAPGNMGPPQNYGGAPPNMGGPGSMAHPPNIGGHPPNMGGPQGNMGPPRNMGPPPNMGSPSGNMGGPQYNMGGSPQMGGLPQNNMRGPASPSNGPNFQQGGVSNSGVMPNNYNPPNMGGGYQSQNQDMPGRDIPQMGGPPQNNMRGPVPPSNGPNFQQGGVSNSGGMRNNSIPPNMGGENQYQNQDMPGRDMPNY